jgi:putative phosphoesterase
MHTVGVIADTHGLVRPAALEALVGSRLIIHAGDIGGLAVLSALAAIAPVVAVRGNNDRDAWADGLPETTAVEIGAFRLYVLHDVKSLAVDLHATGFHAVIAGHSHRPLVVERHGVLFVNPGSAGPRRFKLPVAVARLSVSPQVLNAELITLNV